MKGHIKVNCWKKHPLLMPEKFKGKKTEKAGAAGPSSGGRKTSAVIHRCV
jgi:hypothetical protein